MAALLIPVLFFFSPLCAKDLGKFGTTFPIIEENFITVLQKCLAQDHSTEKKQEEWKKIFLAAIKTPKGKVLPRVKKAHSYLFDPSICLTKELKNSQGLTILAKGSVVNPLNTTSLKQALLFFDGNDPLQLAWAKQNKGIWILTNGNPLDLETQEQQAVYFDQASYLTTKLKITALPVRVTQQEKNLLVEEIPCF